MEELYLNYPELESIKNEINEAIEIICDCYKKGGKILLCGNGGSASDCGHIVGELMKSFMKKRSISYKEIDPKIVDGLPCVDLTSNTSLITALLNDVNPYIIFSQQVYVYSSKNPEDVLVGLSTSGNSLDVVKAFEVAKELGLKTISFTGCKKSKLSSLSSVNIKAPAEQTFRVQEYHLPIYHYICTKVEEKLF